MTLKDLCLILRGITEFELQTNINGKIKTLEKLKPYQIQYLSKTLLNKKVVEIDLETNVIFIM